MTGCHRAILALLVLSLSPVAGPALAHAQQTAVGNALGYELEGAAIPQSHLEQLPARVRETLAACATDAVPLAGQVISARLDIAPTGRVGTTTLDGQAADDAARTARACVERALGTLQFPTRRARSTLTLEISFTVSGAASDDPQTAAYRETLVHAIQDHQPAIHACFARSRSAHESPGRGVLVEFTVGANGRISGAALPTGDLFPQLGECLVREVNSWTVPRPPRPQFPASHRFNGDVAAYD
jgi:hypothetical protein